MSEGTKPLLRQCYRKRNFFFDWMNCSLEQWLIFYFIFFGQNAHVWNTFTHYKVLSLCLKHKVRKYTYFLKLTFMEES